MYHQGECHAQGNRVPNKNFPPESQPDQYVCLLSLSSCFSFFFFCFFFFFFVFLGLFVCVCVCERERERLKEKKKRKVALLRFDLNAKWNKETHSTHNLCGFSVLCSVFVNFCVVFLSKHQFSAFFNFSLLPTTFFSF